MLRFTTIRWKNFLSTGSNFIEVPLDKHATTLITGSNGAGKSTILDALCFSLFGKPFRSVSKTQLLNSINQKQCVVEIEFHVNGRSYLVRRGMKPTLFEIVCDGQLINQDAALRDYQHVLEQQILKLNYKTFTQVVILGSATFVPFMQLNAAQRRDVIEDILDIKVFSLMNTILKEKVSTTKDEITKVESDISAHRVKIQAQKKLIDTMEKSRQDAVQYIQQKIDANNKQIAEHQAAIGELKTRLVELQDRQKKFDKVSDAVNKVQRMKVKISTDISSCDKDQDFFHNNETCPSCSQQITDQHKHEILSRIDEVKSKHQTAWDEACAVLDKLQSKVKQSESIADEIATKSIDMSSHVNSITMLNKTNDELVADKSVSGSQEDILEEKQKMREYADDAIELVTLKSELLEKRRLHDIASMLLKDTGIKTAIIKEYLPVMNKLINKYLTAMDFYVKFELDESFQEVIKSRNRDVFTYDSFSEGEKRRLDLAILFTWRQIAKMKNSVNTNIMVLDEILDGALDAVGIDFFLSIMNQFGDHTNVFVISHREVADKFDTVIKVEKKNEFSVVT